MTLSVFVGTSVDGFISRANGALDFLAPDGGESRTDDEFMATVNALVIGRKTLETVRGFAAWPYDDRRVAVPTSHAGDVATAAGAIVEQLAGAPAQIAERLANEGARHVCIDGGVTIQGFLRAGFIRRLVVTRLPVLIGAGIALFGALPRDVRLRHLARRHYPSGPVTTEYVVAA